MGCSPGFCTSEKIFLFVNIAFAMYSGALLATGARLAWDPSTYAWFRFLCEAQYRVSAAYVTAAGFWLLALVALAAATAAEPRPLARARALHLYSAGVACLAVSEVCYSAWMGASLAAWWRDSPRADLVRRAMDLLHDLKPALLALDRYRDVAQPVLHMMEEVEREAPNNVYVIIIFGFVGMILQVAALIMSRRLAGAAGGGGGSGGAEADAVLEKAGAPCGCADDSDVSEPPPDPAGWRKTANLRMYTILDKIF